MGNLGWYQVLTSMAKKVKGPKNLVGILIGEGVLFGGIAVASSVVIKKKLDKVLAEKKHTAETAEVHTVLKTGCSNEGLSFELGDTFKVLAVDGTAALIEKNGNEQTPYYVSVKFLKSISDYNT